MQWPKYCMDTTEMVRTADPTKLASRLSPLAPHSHISQTDVEQ